MTDELRNAAVLLRRGSWVDPELFERAAEIVARYEFIRDHLAVSEHGSGELPMWSFKHLPGRHATFDAAVDAAIAQEASDES